MNTNGLQSHSDWDKPQNLTGFDCAMTEDIPEKQNDLQAQSFERLDEAHPAGKAPAALVVGLLVTLLSLLACGCSSKFKPISLDRPLDQYRSTYWTLNSTVQIEKLPSGLRCTVAAKDDPKQTPYGGIMLPAKGAKGLRLDLAFTHTEGILQVYVDGFNAHQQKIVRWQTAEEPTLRRDRWTYVFLPQEDFEEFKWVPSQDTGPIETFHVFLRLRRGTTASFHLYGAAFQLVEPK